MKAMSDKQIAKFNMCTMEYKGGAMKSDLSPVLFEEKYYGKYKELINDCYYEMRKELNIRPYGDYCGGLEEVIKQKDDIFLLLGDEEIICSATCSGNQIGNVAVNLKYQRQGYGRKIMGFAISHLQKRGEHPIKLTVTRWNKGAMELYESMGFELVGETVVEGVSAKGADGNWVFEFTETDGMDLR